MLFSTVKAVTFVKIPNIMQASSSILKKRSSTQETKRSTENITRIVETVGHAPSSKYKSTQSLHELGLDNYPNPEMPESSRLTRKEEKLSLQNLNNRLAGRTH